VNGTVEKRTTHIQINWPQRNSYVPGNKSISNIPIVHFKNIFLPPLHLKLGLMKNFAKAMNQKGDGFCKWYYFGNSLNN